VAVGAAVVLAALLLEHQNLVATGLLDDLAGHAGPFDEGGAGLGIGTFADHQHGLEGHDLAGLAIQLLDDDDVVLSDFVLLAAGLDHCKHCAGSPSSRPNR